MSGGDGPALHPPGLGSGQAGWGLSLRGRGRRVCVWQWQHLHPGSFPIWLIVSCSKLAMAICPMVSHLEQSTGEETQGESVCVCGEGFHEGRAKVNQGGWDEMDGAVRPWRGEHGRLVGVGRPG